MNRYFTYALILFIFACKDDPDPFGLEDIMYSEMGSFTDPRDGQAYKTVTIGNQVWMAENLNFEPDTGSWAYNDDPANTDIYGRLYNWKTANEVCPEGWHLPTRFEVETLTNFLGGKEVAGIKMKEKGVTTWRSENERYKSTNSSGFTSLPGGTKSLIIENPYFGIGSYAWYWTADKSTTSLLAYYYFNQSGSTGTFIDEARVEYGNSVRCLKD